MLAINKLGFRTPIVLGLLLCAGCSPSHQAEEAVKARLRDPTSPLFTDVTPCPLGNGYSGQVNAKNGFGAYSGPTQFYVVNGIVYLDGNELDLGSKACTGRTITEAADDAIRNATEELSGEGNRAGPAPKR